MGSIVAAFGSLLIGGVVATTTIVGVVQSQTAPPPQSPVSVTGDTADIVGYGSD
ncbi:hypothetical protein [Nocardioides litoris]|uniref:hypothetical protein n=1 Tax=Nocardioides litoris TaxID=1926648 RepID=UPI0014769B1B|nr:hypothetical protein [Nocardioides litoris]